MLRNQGQFSHLWCCPWKSYWTNLVWKTTGILHTWNSMSNQAKFNKITSLVVVKKKIENGHKYKKDKKNVHTAVVYLFLSYKGPGELELELSQLWSRIKIIWFDRFMQCIILSCVYTAYICENVVCKIHWSLRKSCLNETNHGTFFHDFS